jgi:hypothetical protein
MWQGASIHPLGLQEMQADSESMARMWLLHQLTKNSF